ncbi:MAG: hypothetical protein ACRC41_10445 [Sarcina sp.]
MKEYMNISAVQGVAETKRLTLLSDFKEGEKFDARLVKLSEDRSTITIKLRDGSKFSAKLEAPLKDGLEGFIFFEVDSIKGGVLKLKLANVKEESFNQNAGIKDSIELMIKRLGLSLDKKDILEKMLEFKISLTKENIENINTLFDFRDKANTNSDFIKHFIESYISSKGINESFSESVFIKEHLNTFFSELKKMSNFELMSFVEGNIEFSTENLKSFNQIFKKENGLFKSITEANTQIKNMMLGQENEEFSNVITDLKNFGIEVEKLSFKDFNKLENMVTEKNFKIDINDMEGLRLDFLDKINNINFDIAKLDNFDAILDKLNSLDTRILKNEVAKSDIEKVLAGLSKILLDNELESLDDKTHNMMGKIIKNFDSLELRHIDIIKDVLSSIKKEIGNTKGVLNDFKVLDTFKNLNDAKVSKEIDSILKDFIQVKLSLSEKQEVMKEIIRGITEKISTSGVTSNMINTILKDKINDFKLFNDFSNEYYYLDVPLKLNEEYPCKLIIKDERKDGKVLDSKNMKLIITLKTIRLGDVDALIDINKENIKVNLKVLKENMKILEKNNDKLHKALELLGFMPYIFVSEKKEMEAKSLSEYREFFNDRSILSIDRKV